MPSKYNPGDTAHIVESGLFVREVEVVKVAGGFATLRFKDGPGGVKLRRSRMYATKEDAEASLKKETHQKASALIRNKYR